ncbi:hypothetical protein AC629_42495 [Bradyrhizobium sp. NAS80.1]|nr:hypothetical protein AC629_42495 [Bradyrhizobium sp. NAS80.1]
MAKRTIDQGGVFGMRSQVTRTTNATAFESFGFFTPGQDRPEIIQSRFKPIPRVPPLAPVRRNFII